MKYLYLYFVYSLFIMKFSLGDNSTLLYYRCECMGEWGRRSSRRMAGWMNCENAAIKLKRITSYSRYEWACVCVCVYLKDEKRGNCTVVGNTQQFKLDTSRLESSRFTQTLSHVHSMKRMHVVALTFCYFNTLSLSFYNEWKERTGFIICKMNYFPK